MEIFERFVSSNLNLVWFDLVIYQVPSFNLPLCLELGKKFSVVVVVGGGLWVVVVLKATLVFIFGQNLKTKILALT